MSDRPVNGGSGSDIHIRGYASRFDERDLSGDIVRRGAFAASLLARPAPRPMLHAHDTASPVGVWDRLVEDGTGLWAEGRLHLGPDTETLARLVRSGGVSGLSIGYRTVRSRQGFGGRELLELDLWEVSVVAFPMLSTARLQHTEKDIAA